MSEEDSTSDWAQLVCITDTDSPPFLISKDKFTIGRARGCDISHENNKLVSGTHCYLLRDHSGKVWLYDTSTNGTLFNSKIKLSKGECRKIEHGDEFYVVHKKGEEDVNIGYVFQDLARLKAEEEDDSGDLDGTLEYEDGPPPAEATILDDSINQEEEEEPRPSVKRKRTPTPDRDGSPSGKRSKADPQTDTTSTTAVATRVAAQPPTADPETGQQPAMDVTDTGPKKAGSEGEKGEGEGKEMEGGEGKEKEGGEGKEKEGGEGKEKEGGKKSDGGGEGAGKEEEDAFADTLTCIICQELLYDCVSLQPCMHSFCAGCYSEWMAHSTECPSCRGKVDRINKNHIVNNLVEAYLKEHPEKRRPEEDRKELDAKNKITRDMLYPQGKRRDSSDYENSDEDSSPPSSPPPSTSGGFVFGFGTPLFGASNAYKAVCRQCPTNQPSAGVIGTAIKDLFGGSRTTTANTACTSTATSSTTGSNNNNNNNDTNNNTDQPSTSGAGPSGDTDYLERDRKTMPEPPPYTCRANQNHILCQCCLQIFPDRRAEYVPATSRPQQCTICFRSFCHAYWGCRKADCNGCLAKFADMNFGRKCLTGLILGNRYESDIFTNYLDAKRLAVRDVLAACIARLERGEYSCPDQVRYNLTGQIPLCFACGLRNFKALAYQYRSEIARDQLPAEVAARPDCYWGHNCHTQHSRPAHAAKFNHVCEQTRR